MRDVDAPAARGLSTVDRWELFTVEPAASSADYVAVADVSDLDAWRAEARPGMERLGRQLVELADTTSTICHPLL